MAHPTWPVPAEIPVAEALTAAAHHAWAVAGDREAAFLQMMRQLLPPATAAAAETSALILFRASPPPADTAPPPGSSIRICPRCQEAGHTPHSRAVARAVRDVVVGDRAWLAARFRDGASYGTVAGWLGAEPLDVKASAVRLGLASHHPDDQLDREETIRRLHAGGTGPGGIARLLVESVPEIVQALKDLGLIQTRDDHVYRAREWWRVRVEERGMSVKEMAAEAGVDDGTARRHLKAFGLLDQATTAHDGIRYPELHDPVSLRELLDEHEGNYSAVARTLRCSAGAVSQSARNLLGIEKWEKPPYAHVEWWTKRLDRGDVVETMAAEAGVKVSTAWKRIHDFGLGDRAWANINGQRSSARGKGRKRK